MKKAFAVRQFNLLFHLSATNVYQTVHGGPFYLYHAYSGFKVIGID